MEDASTQPTIQLTLEQINSIVEQASKPEKPKTLRAKIAKAWEKKFLKGVVSLPSFLLGFVANSSKVKEIFTSFF